MGSHDFYDAISVKQLTDRNLPLTPDAAYRTLVNDALIGYGQDAYNGTISTTSGYRLHDAAIHSRDEAETIQQDTLDNYSKWEACGCIKVGTVPIGKSRTIPRTVNIANPIDATPPSLAMATESVAAVLRPGEKVVSFEVISDDCKWKTKIHRPKGRGNRTFVVFGTHYATMNEALTAASARQTQQSSNGYAYRHEAIVHERIVRESPGRVVTEPISRKVKLKVFVGIPAGTPELTHFFFWGWAAS